MGIQSELGLSLRQSQRLVLTPELQRAIKLLPLTTLELAEVLQQEIMENPLLEEAPAQEAQPDEVGEEARDPADQDDPAETEDPLKDIDVEKFFESYLEDGNGTHGSRAEIPEAPPIENTLTEATGLSHHLLWQLHMSVADEITLEIGEAIVHNLDEDGMLRASLEEIANLGPYPPEEVERVLTMVQTLDPPGVAARDLTECLRLQLKHLGLGDSPTDVMVRDHIKQLQSHQYPEIARQMGLSSEEVTHHLEIIRRLDPKPGLKYSPDRSSYVMPDVFVVKEGDDYKIIVNDDGLPRLRINPLYRKMLELKEASDETRKYIKEKLRGALWLLRSVDQRERTIYKVAESIVRHQRGFLDQGVGHLKPLVLRDVAADIGMHDSTVCRVVANKYMHTPRGVYELRFFFSSGITSSMGEAVSSVVIKDKIRKMIKQEDSSRPLSDSRIAEILEQTGLPLARRTVAKYREELRIPQSNLRRAPLLSG